MSRKAIFAVAILALLAAAAPMPLAAQSSVKKISVLTNYVFHGRHSPLFVGVEKGFYKEAGFDVEISPASGSGFVVTAVDAGKADFGLADAGVVVQNLSKGARVKAISVFMDASTAGLASMKPYSSLEELKGTTIAASPADNARVILPVVFSFKGLDPSSVHWKASDPSVYISLLLSNEVDLFTAAFDGDMPNLERVTAAQGKKPHFLPFADYGYDVFGFFLIAKEERTRTNPDEIERFRLATAKAVQYAIANPEEAATIMVKLNPTMRRETVLAQWTRAMSAMKTDYVKTHGYGAATADRLQRTIDLTKTALKLQTNIGPQELFFRLGDRK